MDFELNEIQEMLRTAAARFALDVDSFDARRAAGDQYAATLWRSVVELGWTGIEAPEALGGFGGNAEDMLVMLAELGAGASASMMIGNVILPSFLLHSSGTPLALATLDRLIGGGVAMAFAGYEAGRRYDCRPESVIARREGEGFLISGTKTLVVGGVRPQALIVSGVLDGEPALFLVEIDQSGISSVEYRLVDGTLAFDIAFQDVAIGPDTLLSCGSTAMDAIEGGVDRAALCACAAIAGCMDRALSLTAEYLKMRTQFGRSLSEFQALQHRVADMFISANEAKSILYRAVAAMGGDAVERRRAVSAAKMKVMRAAHWVTGEAIHLHGGIGFTEEYEVGHLFQRAVVGERLFGDSDHHLSRYAALVGNPSIAYNSN